jgi:hypothetical protein
LENAVFGQEDLLKFGFRSPEERFEFFGPVGDHRFGLGFKDIRIDIHWARDKHMRHKWLLVQDN